MDSPVPPCTEPGSFCTSGTGRDLLDHRLTVTDALSKRWGNGGMVTVRESLGRKPSVLACAISAIAQ